MLETPETPLPIQSDPAMKEQWLDGTHGKTRYQISVNQQGLPLLFIHGYGGVIEHWQRLMRLLWDTYTLCAFDLYNLGYSARVRSTPTKEVWAAQAAQVATSVMETPVVVIGHSMGGMVAAQLARDYPQIVRGLVLVNSMGMRQDKQLSFLDRTMVQIIRSRFVGGVLAEILTNSWAVRQSLHSAYYSKERVTPELVEIFSGPLRQPGAPRAYLEISRAFENFNLDIQPGEIQVPVLIVWGAQDQAMPPSQAEMFQERMFPEAEIHVIPETAHCPFDERPEVFCEVLSDWIARRVQ